MVILSEVLIWTLAIFTPFFYAEHSLEWFIWGPNPPLLYRFRLTHLCAFLENDSPWCRIPHHTVFNSLQTLFRLPLNLFSSSLNVSGLCYYTDISQTSLSPHGCERGGELFAERWKSLSNGKLNPRQAVIVLDFFLHFPLVVFFLPAPFQ